MESLAVVNAVFRIDAPAVFFDQLFLVSCFWLAVSEQLFFVSCFWLGCFGQLFLVSCFWSAVLGQLFRGRLWAYQLFLTIIFSAVLSAALRI